MSDNRYSPVYINTDKVEIRSNNVKVEENRRHREHDDEVRESRRSCCFGDIFGGMHHKRYRHRDDRDCHHRRKKECDCY
ncbi:hypothetical protein JOC86_000393 [Bacillus pakistanensis]|uniref:Uncharacterized protein n=1 Tax=Rossellomorea pakistanensis TaxID=992288 RepID=A0ABS2N8D7_9BACI|nr:hypothetical protein [Bacillus pakistanensis]MBM7583856.1 hypothetical protein [Bacillus pakistanensis]